MNVLFVCLHNAGRSQMSEAFFGSLSPKGHEARSAGTEPAEKVNPAVVEVMREVGIELGDREPKALTTEMARWADLVVTMGCGDKCPYVPGTRYLDWDLEDPAGRGAEEIRPTRDRIRSLVEELIADGLDERTEHVA